MAVGWVALIVALGAALTSASQQCFEHTLYNVTIAENAIGQYLMRVIDLRSVADGEMTVLGQAGVDAYRLLVSC